MRVGDANNGTVTWLTQDHQGSAQLAISPTTGTTTQQRYLPFGATRGTQGPPTGTDHGYLNNNTDTTTGLLDDGARYYDPTIGRSSHPTP